MYKMYIIHFTFQTSVKFVKSCVSPDKLSVRMFTSFLIKISILFGAVTHNLSNIKNVFWASFLQNRQVVLGAWYQLNVWFQVWGFVFSAG